MLNSAGKRTLTGLLLVGFAIPSLAAQTIRFQGTARSLDSGDTVYTEHHRQTGECRNGFWAPQDHEVTYRNPDGALIAEKTIDYGDVPARPSFTLTDKRFGERIAVHNAKDQPVRIDYRTSGGDESRYRVDAPANGVIDAGFEVMVRQNWRALVAEGNNVDIEFLAPSRGQFYAFRAEPTDMKALEGSHVFRISVAGWVSGWFVDPIHLAYNDQRQLTDFHGLTNIPRTPDDNYRAHIRYEYENAPECR